MLEKAYLIGMKRLWIPATLLAFALAGCGWEFKRVPPGQSLNVALAKKAIALGPIRTSTSYQGRGGADDSVVEGIGNYFALGNECMQQGNTTGAIAAYEKAVNADPKFADAFYNLAVACQQAGDDKKALKAFQQYKALSGH